MAIPRFLYGIFYRVGFTPWEHHPVPERLAAFVERTAAPGRALDIGCGTGDMAIYLAQKGWDVTAIDFVKKALDKARSKAGAAGARVRFEHADVTELRKTLGAAEPFQLILDSGCMHGLPVEGRARWAAEVSAVAAPGATLLVCAFDTGRAPSRRLGTTISEVRGLLESNWEFLGDGIDGGQSTVSEEIRVYELRRKP